eukprot:CAMPEP_0113874336 /NCGR_PEP_ID=MMETSP0780_2-20120614/4275_1 /TAXON_ID=652834 /ORGANISM="Palpitomonas bilix" /LENGTH=542 /DNA_ID=CAMNT_0000860093 /DNA_START=104 /DNA_END=1732 /DNA_ORIENTATION=- /assembly_acc=CAM_ASM_000599
MQIDHKDKVARIASEVMEYFVPTYLKVYKSALVKKCIADLEKTPGPKRELKKRPENTDDIWSGWAFKEGGFIHNWKKRFFVLRANYEFDYFDSDVTSNEKAKKKGTINVAGYRVVEDASEDKKKEHCFQLQHDERRCYFIHCESAEQKEEFVQFAKLAVKKCKPPSNPDKVAAKAFEKAYEKTRWHWYYYGWWHMDCTEGEMLGKLISRRLEDEVLSDIYRALPMQGEGPIGGGAKKVVKKTIEGIVSAAVDAAWKKAQEQIGEIRPKIESTLKDAIEPVVEAKKDLKKKLKEVTISTINPLLEKIVHPPVGKIFEVLMEPTLDGYKLLFKEFFGMSDELSESLLQGGEFEKEVYAMYRSTSSPRFGRMKEPIKTMEGIVPALDLLGEIMSWMKSHSIAESMSDAMMDLMCDAIYTLEVNYKEAVAQKDDDKGRRASAIAVTCEAAVKKTKAALIHDGKMEILDAFSNIIFSIVFKPFEKEVIPAIQSLVEPLNDAIPDPVKDFVDLEDLVGELLSDLVGAVLEESVKKPAEGKMAKIEDGL